MMNTAGMIHLLQTMRRESNGLGLLGVELEAKKAHAAGRRLSTQRLEPLNSL